MTTAKPPLEQVIEANLWYLNRAGFAGSVAPLLRTLEDRVQVLAFSRLELLEEFRQSVNLELEAVKLEADDWRAREEFLRASADQGAVEVLLDHTPVFAGFTYRLGRAMLEVELHKTNTACL